MKILSIFGIDTKLQLLAVVVMISAIGWLSVQWKLGVDARSDLKIERELNEKLTLDAERQRERHAREINAVSDELARERDRLNNAQSQISTIDNAPESENGPVAPILLDALRGLR